MTALLVLSTFPDEASAAAAARMLVDEHLAACVSRLPGLVSTYRWDGAVHEEGEVLILAEYEEMPLRDIALAVDADVGTVKSRLHRARENLRRVLAPLRSTHTAR